MMRLQTLLALLLPFTALADPIDLSVGERREIAPGQALTRLVVRDPTLVDVVVVDGAVFLAGVHGGVTSVSYRTPDGLLHKDLVMVSGESAAPGMRTEGDRAYQVQTPGAVTDATPATPAETATDRARAAVRQALESTDEVVHTTL